MGFKKINYRDISNYKYALLHNYEVQLDSLKSVVTEIVGNDFVKLAPRGLLIIAEGYYWDGPSGPTIDTEDFMRGSLVHDALYQLMREGFIDRGYRKHADKILYNICREDGMPWWRAQYVYRGVRWFGGMSTK